MYNVIGKNIINHNHRADISFQTRNYTQDQLLHLTTQTFHII